MTKTSTGHAVTEYGAPSAILPEYLAQRLGWTLDALTIPKAVWNAGNGYAKISTNERTLVVFALTMFNGWTPDRLPLSMSALIGLDAKNTRVVSDVLNARANGVPLTQWAAEWVSLRAELEEFRVDAAFNLRQHSLFPAAGVR